MNFFNKNSLSAIFLNLILYLLINWFIPSISLITDGLYFTIKHSLIKFYPKLNRSNLLYIIFWNGLQSWKNLQDYYMLYVVLLTPTLNKIFFSNNCNSSHIMVFFMLLLFLLLLLLQSISMIYCFPRLTISRYLFINILYIAHIENGEW